jgi:hypothetical protein
LSIKTRSAICRTPEPPTSNPLRYEQSKAEIAGAIEKGAQEIFALAGDIEKGAQEIEKMRQTDDDYADAKRKARTWTLHTILQIDLLDTGILSHKCVPIKEDVFKWTM